MKREIQKITIKKGFFKGLKYKVNLIPHSTLLICDCPDCILRRAEESHFIHELLKKSANKK